MFVSVSGSLVTFLVGPTTCTLRFTASIILVLLDGRVVSVTALVSLGIVILAFIIALLSIFFASLLLFGLEFAIFIHLNLLLGLDLLVLLDLLLPTTVLVLNHVEDEHFYSIGDRLALFSLAFLDLSELLDDSFVFFHFKFKISLVGGLLLLNGWPNLVDEPQSCLNCVISVVGFVQKGLEDNLGNGISKDVGDVQLTHKVHISIQLMLLLQ